MYEIECTYSDSENVFRSIIFSQVKRILIYDKLSIVQKIISGASGTKRKLRTSSFQV